MNVINQLMMMLLGTILSGVLISIPFLNQLEAMDRRSEIRIGSQTILAEVVSSAADRDRGLSGRESIGTNSGMLFVFDKPDAYPFWMKGMKFPIDIVWIYQDHIIGFVENAEPPSSDSVANLKIYRPPLPVNKVLELKAGRYKLLRAELGQKIFVKPLIPGITTKQYNALYENRH